LDQTVVAAVQALWALQAVLKVCNTASCCQTQFIQLACMFRPLCLR
jgi:hypothetical protein